MKKCTSLLLLFISINQLSGMNNDRKTYKYDLKYSTAKEIASKLQNTITKMRYEKIGNFAPTIINGQNEGNNLFVTANKEDWERLEKLINELDKPQPIRNN